MAVALDGTCSGIQHYSAMLRDEVGALATNVKMLPGTTQKEDIYQRVADMTFKLLEQDLAGEYGNWASLILANKLIEKSEGSAKKRPLYNSRRGVQLECRSLFASETT